MHIKLNMIPPRSTAQGKGVMLLNGKPHFFTKAKQKADSQCYAALLAEHAPEKPFDTPLSVKLEFVFPFRKSEKKAVVKAGFGHHTTKPDLDNAAKGLLDVMTRLNFWTDDAIITRLCVTKYYGTKPAVIIDIEEVSGVLD
jgi:Holliday junction resolvase RusA-like endonuclease